MLSARQIYANASRNRVQSFTKSGTSTKSSIREVEPVLPQTAVDSELQSQSPPISPTLTLLNALVSSQKQTIQNFQNEVHDLNVKIESLKQRCNKSEERLLLQSDYDKLKAETMSGYEAGVEFGMTKVRHLNFWACFH